eukprot:TRINITY_DN15621_c0_g1_i1.p2 TRINITY_DN15621_c0_g1~~TRINITY_DN15621_c0_g1_i1.p2  ORF type:complete len:107 (+),score=25.77 TRINITY_DN15621_c0_g1_i1:172-492(+)
MSDQQQRYVVQRSATTRSELLQLRKTELRVSAERWKPQGQHSADVNGFQTQSQFRTDRAMPRLNAANGTVVRPTPASLSVASATSRAAAASWGRSTGDASRSAKSP